MGYCTNYSLKTTPLVPEEDITAKVGDVFYDACKWYDHEAAMKEVSLDYPGVLFELEGRGEERDDVWIKYFLDGKMQVCKATVTVIEDFGEGFNPSKLV